MKKAALIDCKGQTHLLSIDEPMIFVALGDGNLHSFRLPDGDNVDVQIRNGETVEVKELDEDGTT